MKSTDRIKAGFIINDRFEIVKQVGEGGFAVVFEGRDINLDRQVAIKVLHGALLGGGDEREANVLERFEREAQLAATVDHGSIVKIYDVGEIEGVDEPFIVMEYLRGCSLQDHIDEHGGLDPKKLLPLYQDLLVGLGFAHEAGIVHKDLKPDNIFYRYPGTIRESFCVVDFGIAHIGRNNSRRVTKNGEFFGTPAYMAPEYITEQTVSPALDVYQMGLILVECLTGKPFLFHEDAMANLLMHLNRTKDLPPALTESALGPIIERAISQKPEERYQNAMEFAEALSKIDVLEVTARLSKMRVSTKRTKQGLSALPTAPGVAPVQDIPEGLEEESDIASAWHAEAALTGDVDSLAFEDTAVQPPTQFIPPDVVHELSEASDLIDQRALAKGAAELAGASPTLEPESEPDPTAEIGHTARQRAMIPRTDTQGFQEQEDDFEPGPSSNNKMAIGLIGVLLVMILVAGGVAAVLANDNKDRNNSVEPEANTNNSTLAAKSVDASTTTEEAPAVDKGKETSPETDAKEVEKSPHKEKAAAVIVQIATVPEGASVFDGDTLLGKTPHPVEFASKDATARSVVVRHDGYEDLALDISAKGPGIVTRALVPEKKASAKSSSNKSNTKKGSSKKTRVEPKETTPVATKEPEVEKKTTPKLVLPGQKKPDKKSNGIVLPK